MRLRSRRRLSSREKTTHATFSDSPTPSLFIVSPPSCILVSSRTMEGTRSDVLACWGTGRVRSAGSRRDIDLQCLLRSIATPITTEPSARLTLPSFLVRLSLFPFLRLSSARVPFSRSFPRRAPPLSLAITNTTSPIYYRSLSFFPLSLLKICREWRGS